MYFHIAKQANMRSYISYIIPLLSILSVLDLTAQSPKTVINTSHIAFTIPEKDLLPESMAYDAIKNEFYVGSTRKGKIIRVQKDGSRQVFVAPKQEGLWMVIGIKVDAQRRHLWVCSSGGDNLEGYTLKDNKEGRPAGIFKFDLDSGKLIKKYVLDTTGEVHFFNDLVIAKNGDVYITHMFSEHAIYKISKTEDRLEKILASDHIKYPNGIALSDDESKLYIAHSDGISFYTIKDQKIQPVQTPEGLQIARKESIDGLYYHNNSLIGVQPDINTVQRFKLNETGSRIVSATPLEVNHPMMNNPTTGEIIQDTFYYVANAQFGSFNEDGSLFSPEKLYEVCILQLPLHHQSKNEHHE